jgi:hypothetical protein
MVFSNVNEFCCVARRLRVDEEAERASREASALRASRLEVESAVEDAAIVEARASA